MSSHSAWANTTLDEVADWGSGGTPSRKNAAYFCGDIPWIKTGELGNKFIRDAEEKITEEAIAKSSAKVFPKGSVGIAMYGATIGKVSIFGIDASTNQACAVANPLETALDREFLYYFLLSEKKALIKEGKGGAQPNISQGLLKDWPIQLPPINEQHRIVAKIEELFSELDKGIESLKTAREQLKVYRQALLKHAFEGKLTEQWRKDNAERQETADQLLERIKQACEARYQQQLEEWKAAVKQWEADGKEVKKLSKPRPSKPLKSEEAIVLPELPNDWAWLLLGENNVDIFDGPFGSNLKTSDYVDEGVRVVRLENIGAQQFIDEKKSFISEEKYIQLAKHTVRPGDLIFSSFVTENTRVALVPGSIDKAVNKADCFCIRTFGGTLDARYLEAYLSTRFVFKSIESLVHGVGRPRINTAQLKSIPIPMSSIAEQREIMGRLDTQLSEVSKLEEDINHSLAKSDALRQSILKKAFSGQLVPQDPDDEPASVLLDRIAKEKEEAAAKPAKKKPKANRTNTRKAS